MFAVCQGSGYDRAAMPTPAERLATLEERMTIVLATIHGGDGVPYNRSIRGRLHELENIARAADNLAAAAREVRRTRDRQWSKLEKSALFVCAAATAAAPYIVVFYR